MGNIAVAMRISWLDNTGESESPVRCRNRKIVVVVVVDKIALQ